DGGYGENDLYVSFRLSDGSWGAPVNMGPRVNSDGNDYCGRFSLDGRFFFFTSARNGLRSTYWIDARVLEDLREDLPVRPQIQ
ncbi:MAG: hypothetical protein OEM96_11270, partial [Gemmatimonadota bacterium]|nr:hypothetical protein [Gemmatimonadota bacterium]